MGSIHSIPIDHLEIRGGADSYPAFVGSGLLERIGTSTRKYVRAELCAIVSDTKVAARFAPIVVEALDHADIQSMLMTVPAGEQSKSLEQAGALCEQMAVAGLDRSSFLIALGGGVIGDLAGFVAAIYHRGIPWVNVPTTLLAMVDSSIGGKTGVNTASGKNLIGAVHHPALVIADVDTLTTLPARQLEQGFAEIIKHGVIADAGMFEEVAQGSSFQPTKDASWKLAPRDLEALIRRNVEIKAAIVGKDENDVTGERALLNFGHTVGHALERAGGYRDFLHGEAVSLGIAAACDISVRKAGMPASDRAKIIAALGRFRLPTRLPPSFRRDEILQAVPFDKKFAGGRVRFVVSSGIGSARLADDITIDDIAAVIANL